MLQQIDLGEIEHQSYLNKYRVSNTTWDYELRMLHRHQKSSLRPRLYFLLPERKDSSICTRNSAVPFILGSASIDWEHTPLIKLYQSVIVAFAWSVVYATSFVVCRVCKKNQISSNIELIYNLA